MECGQYDPRWSAIHMLPEETVQAHIDVKGELLLPIHWGAFTLALHEWSDPIERVTKEANRLGVKITTPQIGESITLKSIDYPSSAWWRNLIINRKRAKFLIRNSLFFCFKLISLYLISRYLKFYLLVHWTFQSLYSYSYQLVQRVRFHD